MKDSPPREPWIIAADTLGGEKIVSREGDDLGTIEDLVIDAPQGTVTHAPLFRARRGVTFSRRRPIGAPRE
jgi:sporulation protein YlmC with PRC-barrel domain